MSRMIDFIYGAPVWQVGLIICSIVVGGTAVALFIIDRYWEHELRRTHNDIAGFLIAVVGIIYAILISSLVITVLSRQERANALVIDEAEVIDALQRESGTLPKPLDSEFRKHVAGYLDAVIDREWPQMRAAQTPTAALPELKALWNEAAMLPVPDLGGMLVVQELRRELDHLYALRRSRAELATNGVDPIVWGVVLIGSVSIIAFAVLFGVPNFKAHILMACLFSFTIALTLVMIVAIDWPFFGNDAVTPNAMVQLRSVIASE